MGLFHCDRAERGLLIVIAVPVVVWFLRELTEVLVPFIVALLLSYLGGPAVRAMGRWKIPRGLAITVVMLASILALSGFVYVVQRGIADWVRDMPHYEQRMQQLRTQAQSMLHLKPGETNMPSGPPSRQTRPGASTTSPCMSKSR